MPEITGRSYRIFLSLLPLLFLSFFFSLSLSLFFLLFLSTTKTSRGFCDTPQPNHPPPPPPPPPKRPATHVRCRARVSLFILHVHYNLFIHTLISMYLEIYYVAAKFQNIFKLHKWECSTYTKTLHLFTNNKKNITCTKINQKGFW